MLHIVRGSGTFGLLMILYLGSAQVCSSVVPSADERNEWLETFYRGVAFPTFARVLLLGKLLSNLHFCDYVCVIFLALVNLSCINCCNLEIMFN